MKSKTFAARHAALFLCLISLFNICPPAQSQVTNAPAVAHWPKSNDLFPGKGVVNSSDWFKKTWSDRRTRFWNRRAQEKGSVIFLGDSITQGWGSLAKDFPNLKVVNRGISGDTTRGVWYRLPEDVLNLNPQAIVLLIGTNDIGLGGEPDDVASNVKGILQAIIARYPKIPVIVCKVMPSSAGLKRPADKIKILNALVDEIVKGNSQLIRCDTWSIFANENGNAKKEEFKDLLHPNAAGYAKWKGALDPIFAKLK